jgi:hypothetical protein
LNLKSVRGSLGKGDLVSMSIHLAYLPSLTSGQPVKYYAWRKNLNCFDTRHPPVWQANLYALLIKPFAPRKISATLIMEKS